MKKVIRFEWWSDDKKIDPEHEDLLVSIATTRIDCLVSQGFTEGELLEEIENKNYWGSWSIKQN